MFINWLFVFYNSNYFSSSSYPMDFDGSLGTGSDSMFLSDYYDDGCDDNRRHRDRSPLTSGRRRGENNGY